MRKVDPNGVKNDFKSFVDERTAHFKRLADLLRGAQHEKRDLSILSEVTLHSVYVAFEVLLSDLMLAYINRDVSAYRKDFESRIKNSVKSKYNAEAAKRTSFDMFKHMNVQDLEKLIDPTGRNLTFNSVEDLQEKFNRWVSPQFNANVTRLTESNVRLIDTTHAIRNFIAHRSTSSKRIMNEKLLNMSVDSDCPNGSLRRGEQKVNDVGSYLKTFSGEERRVVTYIERLKRIAQNL